MTVLPRGENIVNVNKQVFLSWLTRDMVFFLSNLMLFGQVLTGIPVNHFLNSIRISDSAGKFLNLI